MRFAVVVLALVAIGCDEPCAGGPLGTGVVTEAEFCRRIGDDAATCTFPSTCEDACRRVAPTELHSCRFATLTDAGATTRAVECTQSTWCE